MTAASFSAPNDSMKMLDIHPTRRVAAWLLLGHAGLWLYFLIRWVTFGSIGWDAFEFEEALANTMSGAAIPIYVAGIALDLASGILLLRKGSLGRTLGLIRNAIVILGGLAFWWISGDLYGPVFIVGVAALALILLNRNAGWALNWPAAWWLIIFFVMPNLIIFFVSLSERGPGGTIVYPELSLAGFRELFNDYGRFFSRIGGQFIYLRIFWRSFWMATGNTILCLIFGYPFAYWIARQSEKWRGTLIFLVMIPFWTNGLVRVYAWMLLLRDTGLINNLWTSTLHEQAVALSASSAFFARLAEITADPLPLLFNNFAVFVGLVYGFFPFVVLPLYSNLEKMDWSLLEAASDLGASSFQSTVRVLLPLSMPGIVAASILVFIPSLGSFVVPALMGGGKVAMLGNLLQQQFLTSRDWPFGSAIGFMMMLIMLGAIMLYFRVGGERN